MPRGPSLPSEAEQGQSRKGKMDTEVPSLYVAQENKNRNTHDFQISLNACAALPLTPVAAARLPLTGRVAHRISLGTRARVYHSARHIVGARIGCRTLR